MSQRSTKKKKLGKKIYLSAEEKWQKLSILNYYYFFYKKTKYNKVLNTYAKSVLLELRTGVIKPKIS